MENDFLCYQQSKSHCQKCGRRSRKHETNISDRCHSHRFKCQRKQQRLFPTEFPPYPIVTQTNDNHSKSNDKNVLIDQLIEVQQRNATNCQSYNIQMIKNDEYRRSADRLKRVQQMIYLRENINNLTYREIHFPNEYLIFKRLEEKNHRIHQNRFPVDHYFRPLRLQYQTNSTLFQNIPITSFIYSKEDTSIVYPLDENHSALPAARSCLTTVEINDTMTNENSTSADQTDSPILITPYQEFKHQNYSQNAAQSFTNVDYLTKPKNQHLTFETAVIVDVRKCPQVITHQSPIQLHWNHVIPTWSTSLLKNNQQPQTRSFLQSQNFNQMPPQQISKVPSKTTCSPPNITRNYLSDISSSIKYTETLHKLKQILDVLQKYLLKKSLPSPPLSNEIDQSISTTMTSDSLATTYSVSSTVPILHRNNSQFPYNNSTINLENEISQIEADSLNKNYYLDRIKLRNSARNVNCNRQISDDEETENSTPSPPRRSMSPSFMFILQILLLICLIDRIIVFGIVPAETFVSTTVDDSQPITPILSTFIMKREEKSVSENNEKFFNFLSFFKLV